METRLIFYSINSQGSVQMLPFLHTKSFGLAPNFRPLPIAPRFDATEKNAASRCITSMFGGL